MLRERGFRPKGILDIGAYKGEWACEAAGFFPQVPILMIEAQSEMEPVLTAVVQQYPHIDYRIALLGAGRKAAVPYFKMESGSSVYSEQTTVEREVVTLPMHTLDEIVELIPSKPVFDAMKLDVQGAEIDVLDGAQKTLAGVQVVFMELALMEYNKGAPLILDVMQKLSEYGFVLYDIFPFVRVKGALLQHDAVFVREDSPLRLSAPFF